MKIATINERYDVLCKHGNEFPQFAQSNWILIDSLRGADEPIDLRYITEETFIDVDYPDITRAGIEAAIATENYREIHVSSDLFRDIHTLGELYELDSGDKCWAVTMYIVDPFDENKFSEVGHVKISAEKDAFMAYLCARDESPNFKYMTDYVSTCWYCDIVQAGEGDDA